MAHLKNKDKTGDEDPKIFTRSSSKDKTSEDETKVLLRQLIEKVNSMDSKISSIENQLRKTLEENKKLKEEGKKRDQEIVSLNKRVDLLEQRSRINNIEISDFPSTPGEKLVEIVKAIGSKIGVDIVDADIQAAHRVPRFNNGTKNIVVQMCSRWKKNSFIKACATFRKGNNNKFSAKDINRNLPDQNVYVSEHLSPRYKVLLAKAKSQAKDKGWKYVWTRDCNILARKDQNCNVVSVTCEQDILAIE